MLTTTQPAPASAAIFYLLYSTATSTTASGVTVENSVFVAPADLWNPDRAMETLSPMTVANNVIVGFLDRVDAASCNHIDGLLLYSGTGSDSGYYGNVTFTGNLCYDDYNCIAGFDGTQANTITDNACFNIEQNCVELESDTGSVINHNTQQTGGADPSGCAIQPNTQACSSSRLFMNSHKTGQPSTTGETYTHNADGSGPKYWRSRFDHQQHQQHVGRRKLPEHQRHRYVRRRRPPDYLVRLPAKTGIDRSRRQ